MNGFYCCTVKGCNNKYKTKPKLILHLKTKHQIELDADAPLELRNIEKNITTKRAYTGECEICCANVKEGTRAVVTPCGHAVFCYDCIMKWKANNDTCPSCRGPIGNVTKLFY